MSFTIKRKMPEPDEILSYLPLDQNLIELKKKRDIEIKNIIENKSDKFLVIIGPCSADDENSVCDYVNRLKEVYIQIKDKVVIVPRIYTSKPRTTGEGYKGILHQPNPKKSPNVVDGIKSTRQIHIRALQESGLSTADEILYPSNLEYITDLLSYITVGARSVENQEHRLISSGISVPVGMKNPTSGDLSVMFNAIQAAQSSHTFIHRDNEVETTGNHLAHAIMRGYVNKYGTSIPNYHYEDLLFASEMYLKRNLKNPMIVVDTNHANSDKKWFEQPRIAKEILYSRKSNSLIKNIVRGIMIESYIEDGCQDLNEKTYGKSITDPCIGWETTKELLYYIADNV